MSSNLGLLRAQTEILGRCVAYSRFRSAGARLPGGRRADSCSGGDICRCSHYARRCLVETPKTNSLFPLQLYDPVRATPPGNGAATLPPAESRRRFPSRRPCRCPCQAPAMGSTAREIKGSMGIAGTWVRVGRSMRHSRTSGGEAKCCENLMRI